MLVSHISKFKGGWYIGNFTPSLYINKNFEVCLKTHHKKEKIAVHYHKRATEINLVIKGRMFVNQKLLKKGDIFILKKKEIVHAKCISTTAQIIVIKFPSNSRDKFLC